MRSSSALAPILPFCASSQNSPAGNTVLYHLRTKFEPRWNESDAPAKDLDELQTSAQTSTCGPTTVTKTTQTASITGSEAWNHCVPRLCHTLRVNKRYLAVRRLKDGDTANSVLAEFFGVLDGLDAGVKAAYDSKCLTLRRTITRT